MGTGFGMGFEVGFEARYSLSNAVVSISVLPDGVVPLLSCGFRGRVWLESGLKFGFFFIGLKRSVQTFSNSGLLFCAELRLPPSEPEKAERCCRTGSD